MGYIPSWIIFPAVIPKAIATFEIDLTGVMRANMRAPRSLLAKSYNYQIIFTQLSSSIRPAVTGIIASAISEAESNHKKIAQSYATYRGAC